MWTPQIGPQLAAIEARHIPELFYGGAVGGGKSDFLLCDYLQDVNNFGPAWRGIIFRRSFPELEELIARSKEIYPPTGAEWKEGKKTWQWPNGAFLRMRQLEKENDWMKYQGHQYTFIGWDELPQWPSDGSYKKMFARLRSAHDVPVMRVRSSGNPGGPGHSWVMERFQLDTDPGGFTPIIDERSKRLRVFIPARLEDNQILLESDPEYEDRLQDLGSEELIRAWREGDWTAVVGAYFNEFSATRHVIPPCELPPHLLKFRAFDWGSAAPFAVGWFAVSDGAVQYLDYAGKKRLVPKNALIMYREWYGASKPGEGLKMRVEDVAAGILARQDRDEKITYGVADPAIFKEDGGPPIAETFHKHGVIWRSGDNQRVPGWQQVRSRLKGTEEGAMLYFFSTCRHTIRTLPILQHDQKKPEDLDTDSDDHLADMLRYAAMSRSWTKGAPKPKPDPLKTPTFNEMLRAHDRAIATHRRRKI